MAIVVLQGPAAAPHRLGVDAACALWRVARAAGQVLSFRASASASAFAASLRQGIDARDAFVLVDPGDVAATADPAELRDALEALRVPYVEVHDRSAGVLDLSLRPDAMPLATIVINGDLASGYRIALGIALRRLALAARLARG